MESHEYYHWSQVPNGCKTKKQLLKEHRRLKKHATPVGNITLIFDKPKCKPKYANAVSPEECRRLREKFMRYGPDCADFWRLKHAGQLAVTSLYNMADTEEITAFTEPEATQLLEYMIWDHSHEDHFITEDGERQRATWKCEISKPNLISHLSGHRYFGVKKGEKTMQITVDCDRHSGQVPGAEHVIRTMKIGQVLCERFPDLRFAPEINPRNGSVKFFGWFPDYLPMPFAGQIGEKVRTALQHDLSEYDFASLEIYPANSPQIFAPLRHDKNMVIGSGVLGRVEHYRMKNKRRQYYEAPSCAAYLNWIHFEDTQYDQGAFEQALREAVASCPDKVADPKPRKERKKSRKKATSPGGMGDIGRLKGRCASTLVKFWSEEETPEPDTIGKYVIVTLRILKYEGLSQDEAVEWVEDRLQAMKFTEFSDRLTNDFGELQRVMAYAVDAVWANNGYQKDSVESEQKLQASVATWSRKNFFLHDPSTWYKAKRTEAKLVWEERLLLLVPDLAAIAHCTFDQAKAVIEKVLSFVTINGELAESMVGILLEEAGIKGQSRQKQHDVRKFLVDEGLLVKRKNYYHDAHSGYKHGNFYVCDRFIEFDDSTHTTPVSICYLSPEETQETPDGTDWHDLVMEARCLACDRLYAERLRQLNMRFRRVA